MSVVIQFQHVSYRYRGVPALQDLELEVPRGCLFGLIGKSGAGKTTTLKLLLGMMRPDRGHVQLLNTPATAIARLAGRVGVTFDSPALFDALSVHDNLRLHAKVHGRALETGDLLERLELAHLTRRRAGRLSAGQRQRLSLARALVLRPELLILDEPLVHLDPHSAAMALDVLRDRVKEGATVFLSSHQLAQIERVADRLALLDHGRLVLEGATGELLKNVDPWLRVQGSPRDRALTLLRDHPLVTEVQDHNGELRVRLREPRPEAINASLHQGGVEVSLLAPAGTSLDELFLSAIRQQPRDDAPAPSVPPAAGEVRA